MRPFLSTFPLVSRRITISPRAWAYIAECLFTKPKGYCASRSTNGCILSVSARGFNLVGADDITWEKDLLLRPKNAAYGSHHGRRCNMHV